MLIDRTDDSILAKWWLGIDKRLLFLVGFLILIGFVMMFEASPYAAVRQQHGEFFYIRKYPLYLCLGMISMLVMSMMPAERIRRLAPYAFALVFVATVATLFMPAIKNSHRWLRIGSMSVQPSEFLKPVAAVFLASLLATLKNGGGKWMKTKIALMFAGIIATLMSQTDFGMSMTFAAIFGVEVFLAGAKKRWILALVAVLALGSFASYRHIPQVHNRIERFLSDNPEDRRQIDASLEAIRGAGLLSGGRGALKQYIPDVHTDFIFSAMVESFGILLSVMVLGACFWVSAIVLDRMKRIRDPFASLACGGIVGFLTFQVCVNIASALGLIPPKGMTLPFISSGGSSLISSCMAMGIVLSLLRGQEGAK